jgi:hypothetical protein
VTGPSRARHLDLDALADVLSGQRADDGHLDACAECAERLAELAGAEVAVVASLATLPAPALPDGLAERLADALRAEAARSAAGSVPVRAGTVTSPVTGSVTPLRRRRRRTPTWLPAVAAAVALVLAGGFGLDALRGLGTGSSSSDSSAAGGGGGGGDGGGQGASAAADQVESLAALADSSATDYAVPAQRTAALPRLLGQGRAFTAGPSGQPPPAATAVPPVPAASPVPAVPSSPDASGPDPAVPAPAAADRAAPLERLRDPAALAECLVAVEQDGSPGAPPLSLDYAAYAGAPALAVVQPADDPSAVVLTVVGPGCSGADADTLLRTRVARP